MADTGLSGNPKEYRSRLAEQSDEQIDAWAAELMRDVVIRRGVVKVIDDFRSAAALDETAFERVFASGGGPPAVVGRNRDGKLMVPAVTLYALVPGIRSQVADGRARLIEYLVKNFDELVYV
jgi:LPS sulfotransferase NodH